MFYLLKEFSLSLCLRSYYFTGFFAGAAVSFGGKFDNVMNFVDDDQLLSTDRLYGGGSRFY